jgi:hypothetical protein
VRSQIHLPVIDHTCLLHNRTASIENDEVRDSAHIEPRRQLRMPLRIHFENDGPTYHVGGGLRHLRSRRPARPAPRSPEIHEHGNARILNDFIEETGIGFEWLIQRRQRTLAGAAAAGVGELRRRHTVASSTYSAGSDYGHRFTTFYAVVEVDPGGNRTPHYLDTPSVDIRDRVSSGDITHLAGTCILAFEGGATLADSLLSFDIPAFGWGRYPRALVLDVYFSSVARNSSAAFGAGTAPCRMSLNGTIFP